LYLGLGKQFVIVVATLVEAVPTIYSKLLTLQWTRYRSMHEMGAKQGMSCYFHKKVVQEMHLL